MKRHLLLVLAATAPAWAQSRRYPPEPIDHDREQEERSALWESATNPRSQPYRGLVDQARAMMRERTDDGYRRAISTLDQAIALQPHEPEAYALRGEAHLQLRAWAACASDLHAAARYRSRGAPPARRALVEQRRDLGVCLARAGKLAEAEQLLSEAAATGIDAGETLMRLGEVRIGLGKLDEAIAALTAALEATELPSQALTRWLLASAYDRARRPAEAFAEARRAAGYDRSFGALTSQHVPLLGAGETEYLLGLAWLTYEPPRPEHALVYFRRFVRIAPDSPWRRRAEDHVRELEAAPLPESIDRKMGTAPFEQDAIIRSVRRHMPAMRACVAKLPSAVFQVLVTKVGPRARPSRDPRALRSQYRAPAPPAPGVKVTLALDVDGAPAAEVAVAGRCIEPLAARLAFPPIKEPDAWYTLSFLVVSP